MTNVVTEFRTRTGWSQNRLAAELGVSQGAVSRWETGVHTIPKPIERLIARLTEVPPEKAVA